MMINKKGFTLAEILIIFILFGVIASLLTATSITVVNKTANSKMTIAIFNILKKGVGDYIADKGTIESSAELCTALAESFNVSDSADCPASEGGVIASAPNFTLKNGAIFYNFGSTPTSGYYKIYVDIDGKSHRKGVLNDDLIPFIINKYGEVLPDGKAADDIKYLSAGYKYLKTVDDKSSWVWVATKLTYRTAICASGIKLQTTNYCEGKAVDTTHCSNVACQVYINNN